MSQFSQILFVNSAFLLIAAAVHQALGNDLSEPPNIVVLLCDNLGYGDIGCYGSQVHRTPHIDRMAAEGLRLTSFYVSSGVCTPSRASIMTGCYPRRVNLHQSDTGGLVLQPVSPKGLHPQEVTIAEVLKSVGYATAIIGKWHLGDQADYLPTRQGFDSYLGIPYSDDMTPREGKPWPPLPLLRNESVIESGVDRSQLTKRYTEAAIDFIEQNQQRPFFLYLPHAMPGSTKSPFASEAFSGKSKNGPYGDSVEELDWSTGEILKAIQRLGIDEQTLVIWTSDNGAPRRNPPQGSNAPFKGWGYDVSEGAMRMPCIIRWPGHVPVGECDTLCTSMDLYPTFAELSGARLRSDREIDGKSIVSLLTNPVGVQSIHEAFYYYFGDQLQAVRSGPWKLYLPMAKRSTNSRTEQTQLTELYNLVEDVNEERNVAEANPNVVERLMGFAERARYELGDRGHAGQGARPAGWVENPKPLLP